MPANPLIFDGHNDTLLKLLQGDSVGGRSFFVRDERGHIDLPRAIEGGLGGGFFAMFVPTKKKDKRSTVNRNLGTESGTKSEDETIVGYDYAQETIARLIESLFMIETTSEGRVKVVRTVDELSATLESGILAAVMHFEGAEMIDTGLKDLSTYYDQGLRSIGITWSRSNQFGHGVPFLFNRSPDTGPGLTAAGNNLVHECNRLGVLIDLSHLNERGFWDVVAITDSPLVATHSAAFNLCPSTRNLTDKQIDAIGESGGIIGINFHVGFIRPDGKGDSNTPIDAIVDHLSYIVDRIGVDCVGLGSDFDGATMPDELGDVTGLPKLVSAIRQAGFDQDDLKKIAHANWLRVLSQTWK